MMAGANTVNFFQPGTEGAIDYGQIQRQRAIAEMLQKQGMTPQQGQMVSGHYVAPSPLSYVAQIAQTLAGKHKENQADEREQTLIRNLQAQRAKEAQDFMSASNGTPAVPGRGIAPITPNDDEGNAMPSAEVAGRAAVPPDRSRALAIALQSQNPSLQAMGGKMMERQMDAEALADAMRQASGGAAGTGGGVGGPGGIPSNALPFLTLGTPAGKAIAESIISNSKPIPLREGDLVVPDGQGGFKSAYSQPKLPAGMVPTRDASGGVTGASVLPGFAAGNARIAGAAAGAEAEAKDPYAGLVKIGDRWLTPAQARTEAGAGSAPAPAPLAPPRAPAARGPEPTGSFVGTSEQIMAAIDAMPESVEKGEARRAYANQLASGKPIPAGPGIAVPSEAATEYDKNRAKDFAAQAADYQKGARTAGGTLRTLDQLEQLYKDPNVAKGGAAESISALKNLATSAGVDVKGLGAEQGIQAITNKMALDARSTADGGGMPGAMSDADREFLRALTPNLSKSPEGRATIIEASRKLAQRQVQVAQLANAYERANGRLDAGFDRAVAELADKNQMFAGRKASAAPAAAGPDYRSLAAQELERRRKGGK